MVNMMIFLFKTLDKYNISFENSTAQIAKMNKAMFLFKTHDKYTMFPLKTHQKYNVSFLDY